MPTRVSTKILLPVAAIGSQLHLLFHRFGSQQIAGKAYIQASLHAEELPGLLVAHHLINLLEAADKKDLIVKEIVIVPFANPIGLAQNFLGKHSGRFNIATGVNFNRAFPDVTKRVIERVEGKLSLTDESENVRVIREALRNELDATITSEVRTLEDFMKRTLLREACDADIALDLHCDCGLCLKYFLLSL